MFQDPPDGHLCFRSAPAHRHVTRFGFGQSGSSWLPTTCSMLDKDLENGRHNENHHLKLLAAKKTADVEGLLLFSIIFVQIVVK